MNFGREFSDSSQAANACADHIVQLLGKALATHGRATLGVSGGRSPGLLFDAMVKADLPWDRVHVFFVDERAVPPEDPESNYHLANERLFVPLQFAHTNIHRVNGELGSQMAAQLYSLNIQEFFSLEAGDLPVFDVLQHGMGPDGHTASLFPGEPLLADRTGIAAAVEAVKLPKDRVTLLPGVLLNSRATVFLLEGQDKREALQQVLTGPYNPALYPSQLLAQSPKNVDWFVAGISNIIWP